MRRKRKRRRRRRIVNEVSRKEAWTSHMILHVWMFYNLRWILQSQGDEKAFYWIAIAWITNCKTSEKRRVVVNLEVRIRRKRIDFSLPSSAVARRRATETLVARKVALFGRYHQIRLIANSNPTLTTTGQGSLFLRNGPFTEWPISS
jgi:hypothetical protein